MEKREFTTATKTQLKIRVESNETGSEATAFVLYKYIIKVQQ